MRLARPPRCRALEEPLIPLINVVFLLLIFFMLAGELVPPEALPLEPPEATGGEPLPVRPAPVLGIDREGRLMLDGEAVSASDLAARLAMRPPEDHPAETRDPPLQIKADAGVEAVLVIALLTLLREAGVDEIALLTQPRRD